MASPKSTETVTESAPVGRVRIGGQDRLRGDSIFRHSYRDCLPVVAALKY